MTIARIEVTRGPLTEYPLAEKVRGGWQNGVMFYPDTDVTKVMGSYVTQPDRDRIAQEARRRHPDPVDVITGDPMDDWGYEEVQRLAFIAGAMWAARLCICTSAIAGISDGPNVDCPEHGEGTVPADDAP